MGKYVYKVGDTSEQIVDHIMQWAAKDMKLLEYIKEVAIESKKGCELMKIACVKAQEFEEASEWRDRETFGFTVTGRKIEDWIGWNDGQQDDSSISSE